MKSSGGENMDMNKKEPSGVSRREVLAGATAVALLATAPVAFAQRMSPVNPSARRREPVEGGFKRFLAASAVMRDGRILLMGGYDRPWSDGTKARPTRDAVIYDPVTEEWFEAAPMETPRARHAATVLPDGRVAVSGGISTRPTSSVEIYDPFTDEWTTGEPLSQARYDHTVAFSGGNLLVFGGSGQSMFGEVDVVPAMTNPSGTRTQEVDY